MERSFHRIDPAAHRNLLQPALFPDKLRSSLLTGTHNRTIDITLMLIVLSGVFSVSITPLERGEQDGDVAAKLAVAAPGQETPLPHCRGQPGEHTR